MDHLDFEKPIATLEKKLADLRELEEQGVDLKSEISALEKKVKQLIEETYKTLTPWQRVLLSRHPNRPYSRDYIEALFPDFKELHGDRTFGDDEAIMTGVASWPPGNTENPDFSVLLIGHQKGRTTKQKMARNFGMARPEGYRKSMRLMGMAERFRMPIITFIDTPGAYPGIDAEERGQAQAIAESIQHMFSLTVPVIAVVLGEGGSGGALAIGVANRVLMLEYSYYSVIAPESCASILWSDSSLAERAATVLKMNPSDLLGLGVIDGIIPEPLGGAHRDWDGAFALLKSALVRNMTELLSPQLKPSAGKSPAASKSKTTPKPVKTKKPQRLAPPPKDSRLAQNLAIQRFEKFRAMGESALARTDNGNSNGKSKK